MKNELEENKNKTPNAGTASDGRERAVLVAVVRDDQDPRQAAEFLDELEFLAETAGIASVKRFTQRLANPSSKTFVGEGKLAEIAAYVEEHEIAYVIFDDELTPSQLRNLDRIFKNKIYDRTSLILDIFVQRATTAYAKAQVELAQCQYLLPRLTGMWTHLERQRGGTGTRGGAGEREIETDRRVIRDRISRLKEQLKKIDRQMAVQRSNRGSLVRVALVGYTNVGKSTLMKMIAGWVKPDSGTIEIGQTVKLGYFSQENEDMDTSLKVIDYIKNVAEYVKTKDGSISASQMLERFLFPPSVQYTVIEKLSGGERRRLYLLKILMSAPNVLILDEPTNDLDIQTLMILEDYLDSFQGIVITVSHDRYFLDRVVGRIFAFEGDGKLQQYEGGFTDYQAAKAEREAKLAESAAENPAAAKKSADKGNDAAETDSASRGNAKPREKKLKFSYKEQREWDTIEDDIAALEEAVENLEKEIEASATNFTKLNELMKEKEEKEAQLEEKMDRWVYLNDLAEQIEAQKNR